MPPLALIATALALKIYLVLVPIVVVLTAVLVLAVVLVLVLELFLVRYVVRSSLVLRGVSLRGLSYVCVDFLPRNRGSGRLIRTTPRWSRT